jgi:hypothetical protein
VANGVVRDVQACFDKAMFRSAVCSSGLAGWLHRPSSNIKCRGAVVWFWGGDRLDAEDAATNETMRALP